MSYSIRERVCIVPLSLEKQKRKKKRKKNEKRRGAESRLGPCPRTTLDTPTRPSISERLRAADSGPRNGARHATAPRALSSPPRRVSGPVRSLRCRRRRRCCCCEKEGYAALFARISSPSSCSDLCPTSRIPRPAPRETVLST